jgi:hypothetical protein
MALTSAEQTIANLALGYVGEYVVTDGLTTQKQYEHCERYYDQALEEVLVEHPWNEAMVSVIIAEDATPPLFGYSKRFSKPTSALRIISVDDEVGADVFYNQQGVYPWQTEGDYILSEAGDGPQTWATNTKYYVGEFVSTTPRTWATGTSYIIGEFVKSGTTVYQVLVAHTSSTVAADVTAGNLNAGTTNASYGVYSVAVAHTSDTVLADLTSANLTAVGADRQVVYVTYVTNLTDTTKWSPRLKQAVAMKLAIKVVTGLTNDTAGKDRLVNEFERLTMPKARSVDAMQGKPRPIFNSSWIRSRNSGTM